MPHEKEAHAKRVNSTGTAVSQGGRLVGIHVVTTSSAGSVELRDGGSNGDLIADYKTPSNTQPYYIPIPGYIPFDTDLHATLTNVDSVTLYWR